MVFYFVQRGETLYAIARRYQTTVHAIVAVNRLDDPNAICPGQALIIPKPGEVPSPPPGGIVHLVRPGETVFHLATRFGTTAQEILLANQIVHPEFILPGQQLVIPEGAEAGEEWPMLGRTPGRAGSSPVPIRGPLSLLWGYEPPGVGRVQPSLPVIKYDRVFVGLGDGAYYAFDTAAGHLKWRFQPAGDWQQETEMATPAVFDGIVYAGGPDGHVYALDAFRGHLIWKVQTGALCTSAAVTAGVVYLAARDGWIHALETKTGALAWRRQAGQSIRRPVAVSGEAVYVLSEEGRLTALDGQSGESLWSRDVGALPAAPGGGPVYAEVVLLVGEMALDPYTGQEVWRLSPGEGREAAAAGGPVVMGDRVLYGGALADLCTGEVYWHRPELEEGAGALVTCGPVMLTVGSGGLAAIAAGDGRVLWSQVLDAVATRPPAVAPGVVALSLGGGGISVLRSRGGG